MTITQQIAKMIPTHDTLHSVLGQRSGAYGSVEGAVENLAGFVARGQESDAIGRQAFLELVNAIHAPRAEAEQIAKRLVSLVRDVTRGGQ